MFALFSPATPPNPLFLHSPPPPSLFLPQHSLLPTTSRPPPHCNSVEDAQPLTLPFSLLDCISTPLRPPPLPLPPPPDAHRRRRAPHTHTHTPLAPNIPFPGKKQQKMEKILRACFQALCKRHSTAIMSFRCTTIRAGERIPPTPPITTPDDTRTLTTTTTTTPLSSPQSLVPPALYASLLSVTRATQREPHPAFPLSLSLSLSLCFPVFTPTQHPGSTAEESNVRMRVGVLVFSCVSVRVCVCARFRRLPPAVSLLSPPKLFFGIHRRGGRRGKVSVRVSRFMIVPPRLSLLLFLHPNFFPLSPSPCLYPHRLPLAISATSLSLQGE